MRFLERSGVWGASGLFSRLRRIHPASGILTITAVVGCIIASSMGRSVHPFVVVVGYTGYAHVGIGCKLIRVVTCSSFWGLRFPGRISWLDSLGAWGLRLQVSGFIWATVTGSFLACIA